MSERNERRGLHAILATAYELMLDQDEQIDRLEASVESLKQPLKLYEDALSEAESIFGGEYADQYGPMFELAMKARDTRAKLVLSPASEPGDRPRGERYDEGLHYEAMFVHGALIAHLETGTPVTADELRSWKEHLDAPMQALFDKVNPPRK